MSQTRTFVMEMGGCIECAAGRARRRQRTAWDCGGDDGNRTRVRGFADRSLNHSGTSPPLAAGCPARIRTSVHGSKVRCPTTRRRGIGNRPHASTALPAEHESGAEDGTRTRDPHLGKVMLYQLSHFRPLVHRFYPNAATARDGAEGQNRTDDTRLFRAVLYQLSYLGSGHEPPYPARARNEPGP